MKQHVLKFTAAEFADLEAARADIRARSRVEVVRYWLGLHKEGRHTRTGAEGGATKRSDKDGKVAK